jgi:hypothetical protein
VLRLVSLRWDKHLIVSWDFEPVLDGGLQEAVALLCGALSGGVSLRLLA